MDLFAADAKEIVQTVLAVKKYRSVCPDTVLRIARNELVRRGSVKAALKGTKRRLHQICRSFAAIKAACREILRQHSSTRERLPILKEFYNPLWAITGVPRTLLDLGCGLNPLTLPWMDLPPGSQYVAFDIDAPRIAFLNHFFALAGLPPLANWQDVVCHLPEREADVALLLKTSPTLEHQEKGGTLRLLQALQVPFLVVSFSVKSLGGKEKGMATHYEREFLAMVEDEPWQISKQVFETELVFVIKK